MRLSTRCRRIIDSHRSSLILGPTPVSSKRDAILFAGADHLLTVSAYPHSSDGFQIHGNGNQQQYEEHLIANRSQEYEKDPQITSDPKSLLPPDPAGHQAVVFVRRVTDHERADQREHAGQKNDRLEDRRAGRAIPFNSGSPTVNKRHVRALTNRASA